MANYHVTVAIGPRKYKTEISNGKTTIIADEPTESGGEDLGMAPTELLLSALGACKAMTMRMYADHKGWDLQHADIELSLDITRSEKQQTTYVNCHIALKGDLDEKQRQRLLTIADRCPIHKILSNPIQITSNLLI